MMMKMMMAMMAMMVMSMPVMADGCYKSNDSYFKVKVGSKNYTLGIVPGSERSVVRSFNYYDNCNGRGNVYAFSSYHPKQYRNYRYRNNNYRYQNRYRYNQYGYNYGYQGRYRRFCR